MNIKELKHEIEFGFYKDEITNDDLIEILQLTKDLLNLKSVKQYADDHNISPQGVYSCRKPIDFCSFKLVVDND